MLFVLISLALTLFSIFLYIAGFFRLTIPLLYALLSSALCSAGAHPVS